MEFKIKLLGKCKMKFDGCIFEEMTSISSCDFPVGKILLQKYSKIITLSENWKILKDLHENKNQQSAEVFAFVKRFWFNVQSMSMISSSKIQL